MCDMWQRFTHRKHLPRCLCAILSHLHNSSPNCVTMRNLEFRGGVVCVHQQLAEFGLVNSIERLISGDDPLGQQILELFLIPRALKNINASTLTKHGPNQRRSHTALSCSCFSKARWILPLVDSIRLINSDTAPGSITFCPDASKISSFVI